jgi:hypothetical protein
VIEGVSSAYTDRHVFVFKCGQDGEAFTSDASSGEQFKKEEPKDVISARNQRIV